MNVAQIHSYVGQWIILHYIHVGEWSILLYYIIVTVLKGLSIPGLNEDVTTS